MRGRGAAFTEGAAGFLLRFFSLYSQILSTMKIIFYTHTVFILIISKAFRNDYLVNIYQSPLTEAGRGNPRPLDERVKEAEKH